MKKYNLTEIQLRTRFIDAYMDGITAELQTRPYEVRYAFAEAKAQRIIDALEIVLHENH